TFPLLLLVVACMALFALQFTALAFASLVAASTFVSYGSPAWELLARAEASSLLFGAVPSGLVAYVAARALGHRWLPELGSDPARFALVVWLFVWVSCWLMLYLLLGGTDASTWSLQLFGRPAAWYGLALVAAGLTLGLRSRHGV